MNILDTILAAKRVQVQHQRDAVPMAVLERSPGFDRPTFSMRGFVTRPDKTGIIAEFKRQSPSRGVINAQADVVQTTTAYVQAGASALSVLTDEQFFGGGSDYLVRARAANACPILRKDFIVDEYQIIEARAIGADAILLIAAALDPVTLRNFAAKAHDLGLEVLLEVHNEAELERNVDAGADLIGVNNRDLKTFHLSLDNSLRLAERMPANAIRVSESGIESAAAIRQLRQAGYQGFLIGQHFMQEADPGAAAIRFVETLRQEGAL